MGRLASRAVESYISINVESDGPIPGGHSMLSLGDVAFDDAGTELADIQLNLLPLDGATQHPTTMTWWRTVPSAWQAATKDARPPGRSDAEVSRVGHVVSAAGGGVLPGIV
jgi:hypothetical protein